MIVASNSSPGEDPRRFEHGRRPCRVVVGAGSVQAAEGERIVVAADHVDLAGRRLSRLHGHDIVAPRVVVEVTHVAQAIRREQAVDVFLRRAALETLAPPRTEILKIADQRLEPGLVDLCDALRDDRVDLAWRGNPEGRMRRRRHERLIADGNQKVRLPNPLFASGRVLQDRRVGTAAQHASELLDWTPPARAPAAVRVDEGVPSIRAPFGQEIGLQAEGADPGNRAREPPGEGIAVANADRRGACLREPRESGAIICRDPDEDGRAGVRCERRSGRRLRARPARPRAPGAEEKEENQSRTTPGPPKTAPHVEILLPRK